MAIKNINWNKKTLIAINAYIGYYYNLRKITLNNKDVFFSMYNLTGNSISIYNEYNEFIEIKGDDFDLIL